VGVVTGVATGVTTGGAATAGGDVKPVWTCASGTEETDGTAGRDADGATLDPKALEGRTVHKTIEKAASATAPTTPSALPRPTVGPVLTGDPILSITSPNMFASQRHRHHSPKPLEFLTGVDPEPRRR
jgi:hypothetical protein